MSSKALDEPPGVPGGAAKAAPAEKPLTLAAAAEERCRAALSAKFPAYEFKTGSVKAKTNRPMTTPFRGLQQRADCLLFNVIETATDPLTKPRSTIDDVYTYEQHFAVMHPLHTHKHLRKPGDLCCHKCGAAGKLQGQGIRPGTRTVLFLDTQLKVFSWGIKCTQCPGHGGKDYTFSTWEKGFLAANFEPALLDALPWIQLDKTVTVGRCLVEAILKARAEGTALNQISKLRNSMTADRLTRRMLLFATLNKGKPEQLCRPPSSPAISNPAAAAAAPAAAGGGGSAAQQGAPTAGSGGRSAGQQGAPAAGGGGRSAAQQGAPAAGGGGSAAKQGALAAAGGGRSAAQQSAPAAGGGRSAAQQGAPAAGGGGDGSAGSKLTAGGSAAGSSGGSSAGLSRILGPWDENGFAFRQLDPALASKVFNVAGSMQRQLHQQLIVRQKAGGHLAFDNVHKLAPLMEGDYNGMLTVCGAPGNVVGFFNTYSTSLVDVEQQLQAIAERQRSLDEPIVMVTVDNPHTVAPTLRRLLPGVDVKMDVGHVFFSRLNPHFDKKHPLYSVANKKLALSLFEFDQGDMGAAAPVVAERLYKKTGDLKWKFMTHEQLVLELPLSTWKRTVRRVYVQRDQQLSKLAAWWAEYFTTESAFVAMVAGKPKALVRGGAEGLQKFKQVVANQLELVHQGMLSDPPGRSMYIQLGVTKGVSIGAGKTVDLNQYRSTRGSNKNEALNRVLEDCMRTTGKFKEETAMGIISDRIALHNHGVEMKLGKAEEQMSGGPRLLSSFDHCTAFLTQLRVNKVLAASGCAPVYPGLDPGVLNDPATSSSSSSSSTGMGLGDISRVASAGISAGSSSSRRGSRGRGGRAGRQASSTRGGGCAGRQTGLDSSSAARLVPDLLRDLTGGDGLPADWDEDMQGAEDEQPEDPDAPPYAPSAAVLAVFGGEHIAPVQTPDEHELFRQLLPQHRSAASSSKAISSPRQLNLRQMADAWNSRVHADLRETGSSKYTFKHEKHLKEHFVSELRAQSAASTQQAVREQRAAQARLTPGTIEGALDGAQTAAATAGCNEPAASQGPLLFSSVPAAAGGGSSGGIAQGVGAGSSTSADAVAAAAAAAAAAGAAGGSGGGASSSGRAAFNAPSFLLGGAGGKAAAAAYAGAGKGGVLKGVGYGGKGQTKKCVRCTVARHGNMTPDEARIHPQVVAAKDGHRRTCPYCDCDKKQTSRRTVLRQDELIKKDICSVCKKK
ncbi:hypothetical protein OEZ86_005007 [Tetradesmus obliquus]|nr:hypothetical protein OEZ86_005007 [Tetradesmus obliquus]